MKGKTQVKLGNPREIAKQIMSKGIPEAVRVENEAFFAALLDDIKNHPMSHNRAIAALNAGAFDKAALRDIHLDFRYAGVQVFTDAILMAQFHTRQLESRLGAIAKMTSRFLLTLNVLDEFGFLPGCGKNNYYLGNPMMSHPLLFEGLLDDLGANDTMRDSFVASQAAREIRACFEEAFGDFWSLLAILAVAEEEVILFSPPMRQAAKAVGVNVEGGYYMVHGSSADVETNGYDDDHQGDVLYILVHTAQPQQYAQIYSTAMNFCELWDRFWHKQMERLPKRSPSLNIEKTRFHSHLL